MNEENDRHRDAFYEERVRMVAQQIAGRDVRDARVLDAMRRVPRHLFLPAHLQDKAYIDGPLPIGNEQTISQPYIVAYMIEVLSLTAHSRVLEVGTGSGYALAVLAEVAKEAYGVERHTALATAARERLTRLGYENAHVLAGDGTKGVPAHAPYDGIIVSAAAPHIPCALTDELAPFGTLVIPVGEKYAQRLVRVIKRTDGTLVRETLFGVRFVSLIGEDGWAS